jgi:transcriptional regulator with XRE-family HTH domain
LDAKVRYVEQITYSEAAVSVIRALLDSHRMTITQLAEATGISYGTLYRRLTGFSPLTLAELNVIGNVLGRSASAILATAEQAA